MKSCLNIIIGIATNCDDIKLSPGLVNEAQHDEEILGNGGITLPFFV
jgi:hypothetical protein